MIGHISGFLMDDSNWSIHDLVVEAGHWYSGKEILISPRKIDRVSYGESKVFVNITKAEIQQTVGNDLPEASGGGATHVADDFYG
jgi:hypothetical protein